jgi:hypothetical protein
MVASGSTTFSSGRDEVSMIVALGSNWESFSAGFGVFPAELSPANGVPMPGRPGFLGAGFLSDRVESLILSFQNSQEREEAATQLDTPWEQQYVEIPLKSYTLHFREAVPSKHRMCTVSIPPPIRNLALPRSLWCKGWPATASVWSATRHLGVV